MSAAAELMRASAASPRASAPIQMWFTQWVYVARNRAEQRQLKLLMHPGDIKVGCSRRPLLRARELRCDLVAVVRSGGFGLERSLHKALSASSRIKGEWYHPTPEVLELIEAAQALDDPAAHHWPPRIPRIQEGK